MSTHTRLFTFPFLLIASLLLAGPGKPRLRPRTSTYPLIGVPSARMGERKIL